MQCQNAQELFSDYIEGKLDRALNVSLENHLSDCGECHNEVEQLRLLWGSLDELPQEEPPAFFHENIMSRISQEQAKAEEASARRRAVWDWGALFRPRVLAYGAAALLFFLAFVEVVQTQRASLGPVGYIVSLFRPASKTASNLEVSQAQWVAKEQGGTLKLTVHAKGQGEATIAPVTFKVLGANDLVIYEGTTSGQAESQFEITLEKDPGSTLHLQEQHAGEESKSTPFQVTP